MKIIGIQLEVPTELRCLFFILENLSFFTLIYFLDKGKYIFNIDPKALAIGLLVSSLCSAFGISIQKDGIRGIILMFALLALFFIVIKTF